MYRALLAVVASLVLVGVLALLIVESRTVNEEYYAAHAERMRAIETTRDDLVTINEGAQSAFEEGRFVPAPINAAFVRLDENNQVLQRLLESLAEDSPVRQHLADYDQALSGYITDGRAFAARQDSLADALRDLQDESPATVKELRRFNLRIQSQNVFSLAIDIIEYATGQERSDQNRLSERIKALSEDRDVDARAPGRVDDFVDAAEAVIAGKSEAEAALEKITGSPITSQIWALSDAIQSESRVKVNRAERARLLLSVCAFLLLIGTGYVVMRLQSSYRELNKSNAELEKVNTSLEDRVNVRTEELSAAYDDLKESQVQLVQAEKMSSLGELVAGISHEINTPLWYLINNATVIQERLDQIDKYCEIGERMIKAVKSHDSIKEAMSRGLVDMNAMLDEGLKEDIEEARDLVQDSIEGLEELTELAQSLKDFSRLDRSRHGQFNVNDGLDKTLLITKNKLKNKVTVHKHYSDVPLINCSPSQVNQVFLNLITNAADAIEEKGEIVIRTSSDGDSVCISIADTGCGITEEQMSKIRDPFFTTKEVGKGTGLGLSIVDQIVTAHDGELRMESEPGKGTIVSVILPIGVAAKEIVDQADQADQADDADALPGAVATDAAAANEPGDEPDSAPSVATV